MNRKSKRLCGLHGKSSLILGVYHVRVLFSHTVPTNSSHYQDYSKLSSVIIAQLFKVGTRVIPGRDWIWGNANRGQPGTVIAPLDDLGYVRVRWDGGNTGFYRMGNANSYDLALANITGCLPLPSPTNGYQQGTSTNTGSVTTFGCFPPYALQGPTVRTCQANGLWDGVESFCASKYCVKQALEI